MSVKVSFIIPCYKVEKYLDCCVESVRNQTLKDIEIILVDDGSPDTCPKMCDNWSLKDNRIKVIHKQNGGLSSARNAGLDIAKGEYVMFVDSDDFIASDMAERLLAIATEYNLDVVGSSIFKYKDGKDSRMYDALSEGVTLFKDQDALKWMLLTKIDVASWNKIYKRSAIGDHRFPIGRYNEDVIFLFYLYLDGVKVGYTKEAFYHYRTTLGGLTQSFTRKKFDVLYNADEMEKHLHNIGMFELYPVISIYQEIMYTNMMMVMIKSKVNRDYKEEFKSIKSYVRKHYFSILSENAINYKVKLKAAIFSLL